ncbi:MAG: Inner membrane protein YphA [Chlamydiae bacterium]|nr:Inner membrane protein YphA [Chlamydiota bacterium]
MRKLFLFIARALFSLIFIMAGVSKIFNWSDTVDGMVMTFRKWQMHLEGSLYIGDFLQFCSSIAPLLIGTAICLEIVGGVLILTNVKMRLGALLLLIFLIPTTVIYHAFWFEIGSGFHLQMTMFLKNLSILGALLYFLVSAPSKSAVE